MLRPCDDGNSGNRLKCKIWTHLFSKERDLGGSPNANIYLKRIQTQLKVAQCFWGEDDNDWLFYISLCVLEIWGWSQAASVFCPRAAEAPWRKWPQKTFLYLCYLDTTFFLSECRLLYRVLISEPVHTIEFMKECAIFCMICQMML